MEEQKIDEQNGREGRGQDTYHKKLLVIQVLRVPLSNNDQLSLSASKLISIDSRVASTHTLAGGMRDHSN